MSNSDELDNLFLDGDQVIARMAKKASKVFKIDGAGNVILENEMPPLKDKLLIGVLLVAHYVKVMKGIEDIETITNEEIARLSGISKNVVNARLADLKKERFASSTSPGSWQIIPMRAESFLDEVILKANEG
jgi:hypothetical protein